MTDDLNRLRAVAEAATPGPWETIYHEYDNSRHHSGYYYHVITERMGDEVCSIDIDPAGHEEPRYGSMQQDAEFIATFNPAAVLALLDRAERAETEYAEAAFAVTQLAALRAALATYADELARTDYRGPRPPEHRIAEYLRSLLAAAPPDTEADA